MYVSRFEVFSIFGREFLGLVRQGKHGEPGFLDFFFSKIVIWNFIFIYWFFEWQNFTYMTKV